MKRLKDILIVLGVLLLIGGVILAIELLFQNPQALREYISGFGAFGPVIIILLIVLEVIIAPIPGAIISIGSGAAFGAIDGAIYSYAGNLIGAAIAFWLSRRFGRPLAQRFIKEDKLEHYDRFIRDKGVYGIWIAYMFPVFPVDIISYVLGLSNLRFTTFIKIIAVAFVPNILILSLIGDSLLTHGWAVVTTIITVMVLIALGAMATWAFRKSHKYPRDPN
jgi:uncharacterized membrane protein YdjX (TVP38/TMEM64 family)